MFALLASYLSFPPNVPSNRYLKWVEVLHCEFVTELSSGQRIFHIFCTPGSCIIFVSKWEWTFTDDYEIKIAGLGGKGVVKTLNFVYFYSGEHICLFPGLVSGKSQ